jgi:hypothetical protein
MEGVAMAWFNERDAMNAFWLTCGDAVRLDKVEVSRPEMREVMATYTVIASGRQYYAVTRRARLVDAFEFLGGLAAGRAAIDDLVPCR